jgi:hypothetical protein
MARSIRTNGADLSYTIRALYDATNLYISVDVNDDIIISDSGDQPWQDDDVELFFDGDRTNETNGNTGEGFQIYTGVEGGFTGPFQQPSTHDWEVSVLKKAQGYQAEFRIALSSIDVMDGPDETQAPKAGDYIGFNVAVGDDDNGGEPFNGFRDPADDPAVDGFMKWTGTGATFDEANWGLMFFAPAGIGTAVEASTWGRVKQQAK